MKFEHLTPIIEAQQLDEVKMSPKTLEAFADSDAAKGIRAGFEAELIFPGLGGHGDYEDEYNEADDERVRDIDDAVEFFGDGRDWYGNGLWSRDQEKFRDWLYERFWEWTSDKIYEKWEEEGKEYLKQNWFDEASDYFHDAFEEVLEADDDLDDKQVAELMKLFDDNPKRDSEEYKRILPFLALANERVEEHIDHVWDNQDTEYDQAREQFEEYYRDDFSESDWLEDTGKTHMSDIKSMADSDRHCPVDLAWPSDEPYESSSSDGEYSYDNASDLANDLRKTLGVNARANDDYHDSRPEGVWIFEPDGSLRPDDDEDMPVEIISPPMPLEECLEKVGKFFEWAESHGAYSNDSTGFHVGVSLPYKGGDVDYVKLALFLGDKYVLEQFDRTGNHFCESALKVIKKHIDEGRAKPEDAMELMRHNLIELAQRSIRKNTAKYESINLKGGDYIEFRSAGNEGYNKDANKIKNIIRRYAYAMYLAGNPAAERKEYYKKLYKMLDAQDNDIIKLFAEFSTGQINKTELKERWTTAVKNQEAQSAREEHRRTYYVTAQRSSREPARTHEVVANSPEEAAAIVARRPEYSHLKTSDMRVTTSQPTRGDLAHKIEHNLPKRTYKVRQKSYPYAEKEIDAASPAAAARIVKSWGGDWTGKIDIVEVKSFRVTDNKNEYPPVVVNGETEWDAYHAADRKWGRGAPTMPGYGLTDRNRGDVTVTPLN